MVGAAHDFSKSPSHAKFGLKLVQQCSIHGDPFLGPPQEDDDDDDGDDDGDDDDDMNKGENKSS